MGKKTHRGSRKTRKTMRSKSRSRSKSASPHKWENLNVEFMMNLPANVVLPGTMGRYSSGLVPSEPLVIESSPIMVDEVPTYSPSLSPNAEEWVPFQPPPPKSSPPLLSSRAPIMNVSPFALQQVTSPRAMRPYSVVQPWTMPAPPPELWLPILYNIRNNRIYIEQFKNPEDQLLLRQFFENNKHAHDLHIWITDPHPYIYRRHKPYQNTRTNRPRSSFNVMRNVRSLRK